MLTFEKFASTVFAASRPLDEEALRALPSNAAAVMLEGRRIAALCVNDIAKGYKDNETPDYDLLDAVSECVIATPQIHAQWVKSGKHKFATYASTCFRRIALTYLRSLSDSHTDALEAEIADTGDDSTDPDDYEAGTAYGDAPFGLRDPMIEASAIQEAELALAGIDLYLLNERDALRRSTRIIKFL